MPLQLASSKIIAESDEGSRVEGLNSKEKTLQVS